MVFTINLSNGYQLSVSENKIIVLKDGMAVGGAAIGPIGYDWLSTGLIHVERENKGMAFPVAQYAYEVYGPKKRNK